MVDVSCGSGDAQTMCLTDDDSVWSWGDGDYGKLGRGGSDGCKVPLRIDALQGMGVVKVDCGSQFSVALTKSGAVYTWSALVYQDGGGGSDDDRMMMMMVLMMMVLTTTMMFYLV